jgi:hypothetical protein
VVVAEIIYAHSKEGLFEDEKPVQDRFDLVGRLGGEWYARIITDNLFEYRKP